MQLWQARSQLTDTGMDEGTIKTPIPKCRLYSHTLSVYTVRLFWEGGKGSDQREGRGATVHKRGRKYQHD
jgi:hypothetical protein